jgi:pSer/pThr/pTyr-binding forkhead associated (FHA) protein
MIVCNRCGKENQDHYKFCLGCGAELSAAPKGGEQGGMAMMKTVMADRSAISAPLPGVGAGSGGVGLPGIPAPPGGPSFGGPTPASPVGSPLGPPPLARPPAGPPPGVPTANTPAMNSPDTMPSAPPLMQPPPGLGNLGPPGPLGAPGSLGAPGPLGGPVGSSGPPGGHIPGSGPRPHAGQTPFTGPFGQNAASMPMPAAGSSGPFGGPGFAPPPPAQQAAPGPRPCPSCGSEVPASFKFCGSCGHRMEEASAPVALPVGPPPQAQLQPALLTLIRPDGSEGGTHTLQMGDNRIGRNHGPVFENDGYLSPAHAEVVVNPGGSALVRDLDSLNGVFVKMTHEEEIQPGQVIRIGQELLRFDLITPPEPLPDGTEVMGSPNPGYWGKITVVIGNGVDGSAFPLLGDSVTLGRERGEINFPDDGYVSGLHARLSTRDGGVFLADLGSSNGTFVKVQGEREVANDSYLLLGQQLFRLNLR